MMFMITRFKRDSWNDIYSLLFGKLIDVSPMHHFFVMKIEGIFFFHFGLNVKMNNKGKSFKIKKK